MSQDVKIVRLTSGEEILAKVQETETTVTLSEAAILIPAGEGKLAFAPWCPYSNAKDGVELAREHVMFVLDPVDELEQQYVSAVTGLALPSTSLSTPGDFSADPGLKLTP